ncbi:gamma-glutamyltransferase [bacterium]|nr:gamma-glutamyltransferase [bacterium]
MMPFRSVFRCKQAPPCIFLVFLALTACSRPKPSADPVASISTEAPQVVLASREQVEARGRKWVVSTQGRATTEIARAILQKGGNLIDASIAASFAISVERPHSTGIGGGGFLIYHEAITGKSFVYDFRERAPAKASPKMYLDPKGNVIEGLSVTGAKSVAVPGLVRGLKALHARFGHKPWAELVEPAARLAESGFPVYPALASAMRREQENLKKFKASREVFLHADGSPYRENERLVQRDLSNTLRTLGKDPEDFYQGGIAQKIIATVSEGKGILTAKDLAAYPVKERIALEADWRGFHIVTMPPPSSGGIHVVQILKMLEGDDLKTAGFWSKESIHLIASAMQQAFADRAKYLGDPEFTRVPVRGLMDETYLRGLRSKFKADRARTQAEVAPGAVDPDKDRFETTHFSMMDDQGNCVVSTQTINGGFGSKVTVGGTGIVLNNEMDDFSAKVGAKNIFGATSVSDANDIRPGKTPLSSMSPMILLKDGKPVLAVGAPGGTRIITGVVQTILNHIVFEKDLFESIAAPRIHQQWSPDQLTVENQEVSSKTLQGLRDLKWKIKRMPGQSNVMAVARDGDDLIGVADPRDAGTSAAGD